MNIPLGLQDVAIGAAIFLLVFVCVAVLVGLPPAGRDADAETGRAVVYAPEFAGRVMANGDRLDLGRYWCAHPTHPFGTVLSITHRRTRRTTSCVVTDRGPFSSGDIVELTPVAARAVGIPPNGAGPVAVRKLEVP